MFKSKIIITIITFVSFLIFTSVIKNKTRVIEKKLYLLNKKIILVEKDISETQLDFHFLSSPFEIEKKIKMIGLNNYTPIESSKIFLSFTDFLNIKKNLSQFKNLNEKKTKKN